MILRLFFWLAALVLSVTAAAADPARWRSGGWQTDFSRSTVPLAEILDGGPPRDGIRQTPAFRLIIYDRQTQSWWQQFTGEAIGNAGRLETELAAGPDRTAPGIRNRAH